jgi:hypothetical protein
VTEKFDIKGVLTGIAYTKEFHLVLQQVAANALSPVSLIAAVELGSLYSTNEIIQAACAAEEVGLSVRQGVGCFVLLSATVYGEIQRRSFFGRFMTKREPKLGTPGDRHLAMTNYVLQHLLREGDSALSNQFAERYGELLKASTK